jgi:dethiobiotin synthetase
MAKAIKEASNEANGDATHPEDGKHSPLGGVVWKAITVTSTVVATKLATNVASKGWKLATGKPVPMRGDYDKERTRDVIAYTALSGMIMAGTKVAAERKAAEYYRQSTGHLPKALEHTKLTRQEKKAHKKLEKAKAKTEKGAKKLSS